MTRDELEAAGLYECTGCGRVFDSEIALVFCCRNDDLPSFKRNYELGNN